jgi:type IV pilus assembly protein PilE
MCLFHPSDVTFSMSMKQGVLRLASRIAGITRNEAMVSTAVVILVLAVAFPAYRDHAQRSVRADAQQYMRSVVAHQGRLLAQRQRVDANLDGLAIPVPRLVNAAYDFRLAAAPDDPGRFHLTATPKGFQAGEACGQLSLDHLGNKIARQQDCW